MNKPSILVARAVFPQVLDKLAQHFTVTANQADVLWTPAQLIEKLQGQQGAFTTGSERIDAAVLAACPQLKICANMAVGFNNFDVPAMTAAGVLASREEGWQCKAQTKLIVIAFCLIGHLRKL